MGKAWLIASGKGGVGKSTTTACLGIAFARLGQRVCLVDADLGLRDLDAILGLENRVVYDLMDVTQRSCSLRMALIPLPDEPNVCLLAASQFARAKELDAKAFRKTVDQLKTEFDQVLIDCPAGIERGLRTLLACGPEETVAIATPDDVCLRDAERLCAVVAGKGLPRPRLIVTRLDPAMIRSGEMAAASAAASALDTALLGEIPEDPEVYRSLLRHVRLMDVRCPAREAYERIGRRALGESVPFPALGVRRPGLLRRLFSRNRGGPAIDR